MLRSGVCLLVFVGLVVASQPPTMGMAGGAKAMTREQLDSKEIQEMVRDALKATSPCVDLVSVVSGTVQVVNGMKYHFNVKTVLNSSCVEAMKKKKPVSTVTVHQPAGRDSKPVYTVA
uniref:Cystatin domain-containing protein n=1 Tax=Mesocestoides corti TaxID=53468 RepID=A0A5K3FGM9_MESCO